MFYNLRRRIYNNIINIQKLGDGLIRKYQIFNELELETLAKYLTDNNILFRILEKNTSFTELYDYNEKGYKYMNPREYPEFNKVYKPNKLYIQVYKGFINIADYTCEELRDLEYKYGIYLGKRITILTNNQ